MAKAEKKNLSLLPLPKEVLQHHSSSLLPLLKTWAERVTPVLLITGPVGVGKREIAHHLAQWLFCEKNLPCGKCGPCLRMKAGENVDFQEISPEISDTGRVGSLKTEQFRFLKETQGHSGFQSQYRVILIDSAERMTPAAANSLLKLLEEPPRNWVFLLTASDASLILPTLASRCQRLRLKPFPQDALLQLLEADQVPVERRSFCAELSQGSWKRALSLAQDEVWEKRATLLQFTAQPMTYLEKVTDWAVQDADSFAFVIDQLEQITYSLIRLTLEVQEKLPRALQEAYEKGIQTHGSEEGAREFWLDCADRLSLARERISLPLNRKLLAQNTLGPWLGGRG